MSSVVVSGMMVGLVGASGSRKSATLSVIPGFYPFEADEILIDNVPIQNLPRGHLMSQLGFVNRHTVIHVGTTRRNLLSGIGPGISTSATCFWQLVGGQDLTSS